MTCDSSATPPVCERVFQCFFAIRAKNVQMQRYRLEKEESGYIKDDRLEIECVLTVVHKPIVSNAKGRSEIEVPPSDLSDHFGKLLEKEETADVDFIVGGSKIAAHKSVLARLQGGALRRDEGEGGP